MLEKSCTLKSPLRSRGLGSGNPCVDAEWHGRLRNLLQDVLPRARNMCGEPHGGPPPCSSAAPWPKPRSPAVGHSCRAPVLSLPEPARLVSPPHPLPWPGTRRPWTAPARPEDWESTPTWPERSDPARDTTPRPQRAGKSHPRGLWPAISPPPSRCWPLNYRDIDHPRHQVLAGEAPELSLILQRLPCRPGQRSRALLLP